MGHWQVPRLERQGGRGLKWCYLALIGKKVLRYESAIGVEGAHVSKNWDLE